jgi:hypothetical protein
VDTNAPVISWGIEDEESINHPLSINIADDIGLTEVCFTLSGGSCTGEENCSKDLQTQSFDLLIEPDKCVVNSDPLKMEITVNAVDSSIVANKTNRSIKLTYDKQAPTLMTLKGSLSLN